MTDLYPQLDHPLHRKYVRVLDGAWSTREEIAEEMCISEHQLTQMTNLLRNKGVVILSRPSKKKLRHFEYSLGDPLAPDESECGNRGIKSTRDMLVTEMNHIRLEAEKSGNGIIIEIATRALWSAGILTESSTVD